MTEANKIIEGVVDAMAALLEIELTEAGRPVVIAHLTIASDMARDLLGFPLSDEAEPAPVFTP